MNYGYFVVSLDEDIAVDRKMTPEQDQALISDLRTIELSDQTLFTEAVAEGGIAGWSYYFPYLQLFGRSSKRERLLFETFEGSIAVYRVKERRGKPANLSLLVPPFPWNETLARRALERSAAYNADRRGRISRVSESDLTAVARLGLDLRFNMDEFVYDRHAVDQAVGKDFARLRRNVNRFINDETELRAYGPDDAEACEQLLDGWQKRMTERAIQIGPFRRYARLCLRSAQDFGELLSGHVIEIDGKIAAFSFGGPINSETGSVFVTVSDHDHAGIAYRQRMELLRAFPDLAYFNDGADSGRPGMAMMKNVFRPIAKSCVCSARTVSNSGSLRREARKK